MTGSAGCAACAGCRRGSPARPHKGQLEPGEVCAVGELWQASAVELAAMIRDREVSSREVIQAHLDRIEAVNPHLNAVVRVLPDQALAAADAADRANAD